MLSSCTLQVISLHMLLSHSYVVVFVIFPSLTNSDLVHLCQFFYRHIENSGICLDT